MLTKWIMETGSIIMATVHAGKLSNELAELAFVELWELDDERRIAV